ncbi:hypothetical protein GLOIN_2v1849049 [Rhizophagus irregularis DAOM 181602=DAOM 197198]|uniref:Uncharacterized protein n=3 Tax=Rhizophagus irregularis TaxID=588596 RepID=A0A015KF17_RHIIW|nr:hypothetical protein GLOIN_2v1849049 [Rhizophagus irregularis DAOM 181602=DAOM 197198]EXX58176.1 hypothetical protein RirG_200350 [Rhizophagus irregularis DAOM 197198w]POG57864.1 hypothetical protein GLOIN_2v1849049 [Rhizophagus irregularis DAOM 181602=DAOM 197198]|eukprot:XP_025164730.1 hypothetical protein GLOIN_2v1849049 [Rhizophagus irregularis DAOM 181602=DAOM 197198]
MLSNLELLEQCIANLEAKKDELKGENTELKNENAKLKWIIEKNVRRDAENAKHKMRHLRKALVMGLGRRIGKRNCYMNQLPRTYLAGVSNETTSSVIKDKKSQSHKKRKAENIVQDVFDFTATSVPEKNHMTEISMTARYEKSDINNPSNILQNLACLIQKAWDVKDEAILANQKELLCWCSYIVEFNKKITKFMTKYKIGEKKVKGMIYDNLIKLLRPGTKRNTLLKQTQKARDIYKLFEKIGIDKIKYITTYSVNSISELSDSQIQTIVDYFFKNLNTELPDDWNGTIINFEEDILIDQDNVLEEQAKPLVLAAQAELEKIGCQDKGGAPIPQPETLVHDRFYFHNKTLDQYPNLYREFSSEDFDCYGINDETLCPLCKLDYDDEEGINGMYKSGSYFIKCE